MLYYTLPHKSKADIAWALGKVTLRKVTQEMVDAEFLDVWYLRWIPVLKTRRQNLLRSARGRCNRAIEHISELLGNNEVVEINEQTKLRAMRDTLTATLNDIPKAAES